MPVRNLPAIIFVFIFLTLFMGNPCSALADADTARTVISTTVSHINFEVAGIKKLAAEKKLDLAMARLEALNDYIEDNLSIVFYDKVQEICREDSSYTLPPIDLALGTAFTTAYWQEHIDRAKNSYRLAKEGFSGLSANRYLDKQDQIWTYLKAIKEGFDGVKSVAENIIAFNPVGLAWEFYNLTKTVVDQYTLVEQSKQQKLDTQVLEAQIKTLITRTAKTIEKMKELKSIMVVFRDEARQLELHTGNIARYVNQAGQACALPDYTSTRYNFDPEPFLVLIRNAATDFNNDEICWEVFDKIYLNIREKALQTYQEITENVNNSNESASNKTFYLNQNTVQWDYFDTEAENLYIDLYNARVDVLGAYQDLVDTVDLIKTTRDTAIRLFMDTSDWVDDDDLRCFEEEDHNIVQIVTGLQVDDPYYFARQYAPLFPTGPVSNSPVMPCKVPSLSDIGRDDFPGVLERLSKAYLNMARAALVKPFDRKSSDRPVGYFSASPLDHSLMSDVEYNLTVIKGTLDDYEQLMESKLLYITAAETEQAKLVTAEAALSQFMADNWKYLCLDSQGRDESIDMTWDKIIFPIYQSAVRFPDAVEIAMSSIQTAQTYIGGQNAFNEALASSETLLENLKDNQTLSAVIQFIVSDYGALPYFPSEQGYKDFIKQIEWVHAFFFKADLSRSMDLRETVKALCQNVYFANSADSLPDTLVTSVPLASWFKPENPYTVMPENMAVMNGLINALGLWDDLYVQKVREGFPGWASWASDQLAQNWPETNTDDIRPVVVHFMPGRNSEKVSLYAPIEISFSEAMDEASITDDTILVLANGQKRSARVTYLSEKHRAIVTIDRFIPNTLYTVDITDAVIDLAGNALVPETWSFTSQAIPETSDPEVNISDITITGVTHGESYALPVVISIQVSSGSFAASLSRNGDPFEPILSGHPVSLPGQYHLRVTSSQQLSRNITFFMGTGTQGFTMDPSSRVYLPERDNCDFNCEYPLAFMVYGKHAFYQEHREIHMQDLLTGAHRFLFETGYVYDDPVPGATDTYASILGVYENLILYYKNMGTEGPGVNPEDKTFQLFIYNLTTGQSSRVPTPGAESISKALIYNGMVVWADTHSGIPSLYRWQNGMDSPEMIQEITDLQDWQILEVKAFDGEWLVYLYNSQTRSDCLDTTVEHDGLDLCRFRADTLFAVNILTGEHHLLNDQTSDHPLKVGKKVAISRGRVAYVLYQAYRDLTVGIPPTIVESCGLYLEDIITGASIQISNKPHIDYPLQMSESLLYYTEVKQGAPYNPFGIQSFSQMENRLHDLFTHQEMIVDFGDDFSTRSNASLFGNQLVTDRNPPKAIVYGKSLSPEIIVLTQPAADALDVEVSTDIQVHWSGAMNPDTMTAETIALSRFDEEDTFIERVHLDYSYDMDTDVLTLSSADLVSHGRYRVYLDGGIEDAQGLAIIRPVTWFFKTRDVHGPVMIGSSPAPNSTTMLPTAAIKLHFNEPIDSQSVVDGILLKNDNTIVPATVSAASNSVVILPDTELLANTLYTVEISTTLMDESGNPINQAQSVFFKTCKVQDVDGDSTLAFLSGSSIFIKQGTQAPTQAVSDLFNLSAIAWSPDGGTLFYGGSELFSYTPATGITALVDTGLGFLSALDFDGDKIIYARQKPGAFIYQVIRNSTAGDLPEVLFEYPNDAITTLDLSPDGKFLAIVINQGYTKPPLLGIVTLSTDETHFVQGYGNMAWSRDSKRLFALGTGDVRMLTAFDLELKNSDPIRDMTPYGAMDLSVSHSGNHIAVRGDALDIINIHTGRIEQSIAYSPGMMGRHRVVWSSDDTAIFFGHLTTAQVPQILKFDLVSSTVSVIAQDAHPMMMPNPLFDLFSDSVSIVSEQVVPIQEETPGQKGLIHLSWEDHTPPAGLINYNIYRSDTGFTYITGMIPVASVTTREFIDTGVPEASKAYYAVTQIVTGQTEPRAVNPFGPLISGDGDSLDNRWELRFFTDLSSLPTEDPDKDGLTNEKEFREFTDPTRADTDGDLVSDGAEVTAGFNPLIPEIPPLDLSFQLTAINVGDTVSLTATGGSGAYTWTSSAPDIVPITNNKTAVPVQAGVVTLTVADALFADLPAVSITLTIINRSILLNRTGAIILQKNGFMDLKATGGSGVYDWIISDESIAVMEDYGVNKRITSLGADGAFNITISDHFYTDLPLVQLDITAGIVPGDVNGNSLVEFDDALLLIRRLSDMPDIPALHLNADMDGNDILDMKDAILIFNGLSEE